ncbi:MAG: segregation/condensation protein A [Verrucomicrobiota bacterium]
MSVLEPDTDPWRVDLPVFEGPLDLLLYLIKREEVDIYEVELGTITNQYLSYLDELEKLDLEIAGEFLVVAANLVYIKSRTLLPVDQQPPEEDAEEEDPRWELIRQLVEYKKFKEAAESLESHALVQEKIFYRQGGNRPKKPKSQPGLGTVEVLDLVRAFQQILQAAQERHGFREIYEDKFTVSEKIEYVLDRIAKESKVKFSSLFYQTSTRGEIVVTFLAVLELIRLKQLRFEQSEVFGEIDIIQAKPIVEGIEIKGAFEDE